MLADAALTGLAASMRTFAPLGALAAHGRLPRALLALSALELVYDKTRFARSRIEPPSLAVRTLSGTLGGAAAAGSPGALAGGGAAFAGTFATYRFRAALCPALVEDALAYGLALAAHRRRAGS